MDSCRWWLKEDILVRGECFQQGIPCSGSVPELLLAIESQFLVKGTPVVKRVRVRWGCFECYSVDQQLLIP
jgi:hypothetical protein